MEGWISIHRSLCEHGLWLSEPFTRGQAWVDLLLLANHEASYFYVRGIKVDVGRGQVGWSEPKIALRWKWSRTKLRSFLKSLEKEQQIIQHKDNVTQILTIVNYDKYQPKEQQAGQQKDSRKTAEEQQKDVNNNDNNDNNENNILDTVVSENPKMDFPVSKEELCKRRKDEFYKTLTSFLEKYPKDMIREFFDYWSEPNKSKSKMKFELEATWDLAGRLRTWEKNKFKFDKLKPQIEIKPYSIAEHL